MRVVREASGMSPMQERRAAIRHQARRGRKGHCEVIGVGLDGLWKGYARVRAQAA